MERDRWRHRYSLAPHGGRRPLRLSLVAKLLRVQMQRAQHDYHGPAGGHYASTYAKDPEWTVRLAREHQGEGALRTSLRSLVEWVTMCIGTRAATLYLSTVEYWPHGAASLHFTLGPAPVSSPSKGAGYVPRSPPVQVRYYDHARRRLTV